MELKNIF